MREIQLSGGYVARVSDEDYDYLMRWKWGYKISSSKHHKNVYARRNTNPRGTPANRQTYYMHLIILERMGCKPEGNETGDHADNDTLNNERYNLSYQTRSKQNANQRRWKQRPNATPKNGIQNSGPRL